MVQVALTGATGRMGRTVLAAAGERADVQVALAINRNPDEDAVAGVPLEDAADLPSLLDEHEPDVLVDFTGPASSLTYVEAAADAGVAAVVGTTGFDGEELDRLREASDRIPVTHAANFSRGIQALLGAVRDVTARLPGYDVEVTETHHSDKRDAPSGTAKRILAAVEAVRGDAELVHGREGHAPRAKGEVGVHARRAGGVASEHEIMLADENEVVTLSHRASDRSVFADGALDAAEWLVGRDPGWYEFDEVLDDGGDAR